MKNGLVRIAVFVSGGGSNLQAVIDGIRDGKIQNAEIVLIVSSSSSAHALKRAEVAGIHAEVFEPNSDLDEEERNRAILYCLQEANVQFILLAGYMRILSPDIVRAYPKRILNIHPSLIPKYCGMGYYGKRVHEAVLAAGEKESGATVHFVDEGVDTGDIILQRKVVVLDDDTAESLAERVLTVEHEIVVEAVALIVQNLGGEK